MKLRQREIEIVARHIKDALLDGDFLVADDEDDLCAAIARVITEDLQVEDRLNEEVRQLLAGYSTEIEKNQVEYHRAFNLVKSKLARERNLIL